MSERDVDTLRIGPEAPSPTRPATSSRALGTRAAAEPPRALPELLAALDERQADVARLRIAGSCENGGLLAAHWRSPESHSYALRDPHRITLVFFLSGSRVSFSVPAHELTRTAGAGRVSVLPPGACGRWHCPGPMEYLQVCLPAPLTTETSQPPVDCACLVDDPALFRIGLALVDLVDSPEALAPSETTAWSTVIGSHLARHYGETERYPAMTRRACLSAARIQRIVDHIDAELHQALTVERLAELAGMSRSKFAAMFKRSTGLSPHQFVIARRIRRARELLCASELALSEIAECVGFSSQSHMTSTFRRHTGLTPREYRGQAAAERAG